MTAIATHPLYVRSLWLEQEHYDLTPVQWGAVQALHEAVPGFSVLVGPAGTGKTTVTLALILEAAFASIDTPYAVHVTAPTHKAAKVLNRKLEPWAPRLEHWLPQASTIHSVLRLKPRKTPPGDPEAFDQTGTPVFGAGDLLIVDECSMVGAGLYEHIVAAQRRFGLRVVFCGDRAQLWPVNEARMSPTFSGDHVVRVELTEVLRHGGAILDLATEIRSLHRHCLPQVATVVGEGSAVYAHKDMAAMEEAWLKALPQAPEGGVVFLSHTNKERRRLNQQARQALYGTNVPAFMAGDRLVMIKAHEIEGQIVLANNADVEVASADLVEDWQPVPALSYRYNCWRLRLVGAPEIMVLTEGDRQRHAEDVKALGAVIRKQQEAAKGALEFAEREARKVGARDIVSDALVGSARDQLYAVKQRWPREYFALKDAFAEVDFGYALTIHKSQGSTYDKVFIHEDYTKARDERKRLLYVAVTRAAKEVHHLAM